MAAYSLWVDPAPTPDRVYRVAADCTRKVDITGNSDAITVDTQFGAQVAIASTPALRIWLASIPTVV